jgi:hypothetical protein
MRELVTVMVCPDLQEIMTSRQKSTGTLQPGCCSGAQWRTLKTPCLRSVHGRFPEACGHRFILGGTFRVHIDQLLYGMHFAADEDDVRNLDRCPALARCCRLEVTGAETQRRGPREPGSTTEGIGRSSRHVPSAREPMHAQQARNL